VADLCEHGNEHSGSIRKDIFWQAEWQSAFEIIFCTIELDDRGSRVRFPAGAGKFLFTTTFRTALGPTQPPIQGVAGALSLGVQRSGREAGHSPPSSAGYILLTRTRTYYMTDPSSRQGGCPITNETATVLSTAKICSWVPEGLSAKMEKLTDNQFQSNWLW